MGAMHPTLLRLAEVGKQGVEPPGRGVEAAIGAGDDVFANGMPTHESNSTGERDEPDGDDQEDQCGREGPQRSAAADGELMVSEASASAGKLPADAGDARRNAHAMSDACPSRPHPLRP